MSLFPSASAAAPAWRHGWGGSRSSVPARPRRLGGREGAARAAGL